ncbi:MAG: hypothetical protein JWR55_939, partial [Aeromicrobium sp.]|nr:hypothetical protein [Aeromicrobium sp.]
MKHVWAALALSVAASLTMTLTPLSASAQTVTPAPTTSSAAVLTPTTTTVTAPAQVTRRVPVTVTAQVSGAGVPATGTIRFEQQTATGWATLGDAPVDAAGTAAVVVSFDAPVTNVRATYLGAEGYDPSSS